MFQRYWPLVSDSARPLLGSFNRQRRTATPEAFGEKQDAPRITFFTRSLNRVRRQGVIRLVKPDCGRDETFVEGQDGGYPLYRSTRAETVPEHGFETRQWNIREIVFEYRGQAIALCRVVRGRSGTVRLDPIHGSTVAGRKRLTRGTRNTTAVGFRGDH